MNVKSSVPLLTGPKLSSRCNSSTASCGAATSPDFHRRSVREVVPRRLVAVLEEISTQTEPVTHKQTAQQTQTSLSLQTFPTITHLPKVQREAAVSTSRKLNVDMAAKIEIFEEIPKQEEIVPLVPEQQTELFPLLYSMPPVEKRKSVKTPIYLASETWSSHAMSIYETQRRRFVNSFRNS